MQISTAQPLEDAKINVRLKLAALWIAVLFLFAYGDIFGFFRPGLIDEIQAGKVSVFQIDQSFLLATSAYILVPSVMVFLSLVLKPGVARWANVILAPLYAASILLSCIGVEWAFYIFLSIAESVLLVLIVWYAWRWPKQG